MPKETLCVIGEAVLLRSRRTDGSIFYERVIDPDADTIIEKFFDRSGNVIAQREMRLETANDGTPLLICYRGENVIEYQATLPFERAQF